MVVCFIQIYSTLGIGAARDMTGNGQFNSIWLNYHQIDSQTIKHLFLLIFPLNSTAYDLFVNAM